MFFFSPLWILSLSKEMAGAFYASAVAGPSGAFQMERVSTDPGFPSSLHTQTGRIETGRRRDPAKGAQSEK